MPPLRNDPIIDFTDDTMSVGHWGPLQLQFFWKTATVFHMQRLDIISQPFVKGCPNGYAVLSLVQPGISVPPADVREAASKLLTRFPTERKSAIVVLEYSGAIAQLVVSLLRGFNAMSGKKQVQICGSLREAAAQLATVLTAIMGRPVTADEVSAAAEQVRQITRPAAKPAARAATSS